MRNLLFFLILSVLGSSMAFAQSNWFVGPMGTDAQGNGQSQGSPYQTINYAISGLAPGDTLNVMTGTYQHDSFGNGDWWKGQPECTIYINNLHGMPGQSIVVRPLDGNTAVLKGDGLAIVHVKNSSYIQIEGFEAFGETDNIPLDSALQYQFIYKDTAGNIRYRLAPHTPDSIVQDTTLLVLPNGTQRPSYFNTQGILVNNSHHVKINGNVVHHMPGEGIRGVNSDYLDIEQNEVHNCSRRSSTGVHGVSLYTMKSIDSSNAAKVRLIGNHVHDNYNEVYSWSNTKTFITPHIDEGKGLTVQRCTYSRGWEFGRILMANNVAHHNGFAGLQVNEGERVDLINNTLYYNTRTSTISGMGNQHGISAQSGSDDIRIYNNIVVADTNLTFGRAINISSNTTQTEIGSNIVVGTLNQNADSIDVQTVYGDPLFVNPALFDFQLQSNSPGIDVANAAFAPALDLVGTVRGNMPDCGAYEYVLPLGISDAGLGWEIFPNPANEELVIRNPAGTGGVVTIYDISGRELRRFTAVQSPTNREMRIDVSPFPPGIYLLQHQQQVKKLIIHRN